MIEPRGHMTASNPSKETSCLQRSKRLCVLISAYACVPNHGSEPEVGWAFATAMARYHDVWVLTRTDNRERIEQELSVRPVEDLRFLYYDPPEFFEWGRHGGWRMQLHSYFWQLLAIRRVRQFHKEIGFDMAHHVTFAKYWAPSCLAWLDVPFVWGPVGGAEMTPRCLLSALNWKEILLEGLKWIASRTAEMDLFVRKTARAAAVSFASTKETAVRLEKIGCRDVRVQTQVGMNRCELGVQELPVGPFRFISVGRLVHWKGFLLGLKAFEKCGIPGAEYWVVGDGPGRAELEKFAGKSSSRGHIRFFGSLPFKEVAGEMAKAHVLVHTSFHDSAGLVCLEAMAAGKPVICLDTGGPTGLVGESCGFRVHPVSETQVIDDLSEAMRQLASSRDLCRMMGGASVDRVDRCFLWEKKAENMAACYQKLIVSEGLG